MADAEKVIKTLECCIESDNCGNHSCPYWDFDGEISCRTQMEVDALDLLKSQQAEIDGLIIDLAAEKEEAGRAAELLKSQQAETDRLKDIITKARLNWLFE